ncbi:MAG: hypothetical protein MSR67_04140 [Oscillospiraceae bacterium]|nr:hypothetical protein [Oscillospiraceae bacterium]
MRELTAYLANSTGFCEALAISAASSRRIRAGAAAPVEAGRSRLHPHLSLLCASEQTLLFADFQAIFRASNPKNRAGAATPVKTGRAWLHPHC